MFQDPNATSNDEPLQPELSGTDPESQPGYPISMRQLAYDLVRFSLVSTLLVGGILAVTPVIFMSRDSHGRTTSSQKEWTSRQAEMARAADIASQPTTNTPTKDHTD